MHTVRGSVRCFRFVQYSSGQFSGLYARGASLFVREPTKRTLVNVRVRVPDYKVLYCTCGDCSVCLHLVLYLAFMVILVRVVGWHFLNGREGMGREGKGREGELPYG